MASSTGTIVWAGVGIAALVASGLVAAPAQAAPREIVRTAGVAVRVGDDGLAHPDVADPAPTRSALVETPLDSAPVADGQTPEVGLRARSATEAAPTEGPVARSVDVDGASLIGVTWSGEAPDGIEFRAHSEDGTWTDWTTLDLDDAEPGGGTDPWWTGGSQSVEVRAWRDGVDAVSGLKLVAIDTEVTATDEKLVEAQGITSGSLRVAQSSLSATGTATRTATTSDASVMTLAAAPTMPTVISRSQWGADPSLLTWTPGYASTTLAAVVHHTAGVNTYTAAQSAGIVRGIYSYHATSRGWGDIGYNVLVDQYGQIFEGRAGGLTLPTVGAHAGGYNSGTFGVSMMGDYSSVTPSAALRESVARIIAWKIGGSYRFDALGSETLVAGASSTSRYPAGTVVPVYHVIGHRDVSNTACPGAAGYAALPGIRQRVDQLTGQARTSVYDLWVYNGGRTGPLGDVHQIESATLGGSAAYFTGGYSITQRNDAGTHLVSPRMRQGWLRNGGLDGVGFAASTEDPVGDGRGTVQNFSSGMSLLQSPTTGAFAVGPQMRQSWWARGGARGLGYPVGDQQSTGSGGLVLSLDSGARLVRLPSGATRTVWGGIGNYWLSNGGPARFGFPAGEPVNFPAGRGGYSPFEYDMWIVDGPGVGTYPLWGAIKDQWAQNGAWAMYGHPSGEPQNFPGGGGYSPFTSGAWIAWSQSTGAHSIWGSIRDRWMADGGPSRMGFPTTEPVNSTAPSGGYSPLSSGAIVTWSARTGTHVLWGDIASSWRTKGGPERFGYPVAEPVNYTNRAGGYSALESARLVWTPARGTIAVREPLLSQWMARGGEDGSLGMPIAEQVVSGGVVQQRFERGNLSTQSGN